MQQGIVICTWSGGEEQFRTLYESLPDDLKYPVLIVINGGEHSTWIDSYKLWKDTKVIKLPYDGYEMGAIKVTLAETDWEEFILLQDTFEILDPTVFELIFTNYPNKSVAYNGGFQMYLGKYRRKVLAKINLPDVRSKVQAIHQEAHLSTIYRMIEKTEVFNPDFTDTPEEEEKWGRLNRIIKDQYIIKRKGTWDVKQLNLDNVSDETVLGFGHTGKVFRKMDLITADSNGTSFM